MRGYVCTLLFSIGAIYIISIIGKFGTLNNTNSTHYISDRDLNKDVKINRSRIKSPTRIVGRTSRRLASLKKPIDAWIADIELANSEKNADTRERKLMEILHDMAIEYPQHVACCHNNHELPKNNYNDIAEIIVNEWSDSLKALEWVVSNRERFNDVHVLGSALGKAASEDASVSMAIFNRIALTLDSASSSRLFREMIKSWSKKDINCAINYIKTLPLGAKRSSMISALSYEWADKDLDGSIKFLDTLEDHLEAKDLVHAVIAKQLNEGNDPIKLINWCSQYPEAIRTCGHDAIIRDWSMRNPRAALDFVLSESGSDMRRLALSVATNWGIRDPDGAAEAIGTVSDPLIKGELTGSVIKVWLRQDPQAATKWLGSLPSGNQRDVGIAKLIKLEKTTDYNTLYLWICQVHDESLRTKLEDGLFHRIEKDVHP